MIIGVRSIALADDTRQSWRAAGVRMLARSRKEEDLRKMASKYEAIINMGNLSFTFNNMAVPVFNHPDSVRFVSHPVSLARNMTEFLPEIGAIQGPHWHKKGGYGGKGKEFHPDDCHQWGGVIQKHISGTEYRVITVGDRVVQAHEKLVLPGVGNFDWAWAGVDGIRKNGIIPHVKEAITHVPSWETTVFGWDIIVGEDKKVYTIEINTSPGVNEMTARRIVNGMNERIGLL